MTLSLCHIDAISDGPASFGAFEALNFFGCHRNHSQDLLCKLYIHDLGAKPAVALNPCGDRVRPVLWSVGPARSGPDTAGHVSMNRGRRATRSP